MTHKGCVLQRVSLGALSDVMVILGMRQSIVLLFVATTTKNVRASTKIDYAIY